MVKTLGWVMELADEDEPGQRCFQGSGQLFQVQTGSLSERASLLPLYLQGLSDSSNSLELVLSE